MVTSQLEPQANHLKQFSILDLQICGSHHQNVMPWHVCSMKSMTAQNQAHTKQMEPNLLSGMELEAALDT